MRTEFVSFLSTDKLKLPGLLFQPNHKTNKVAVYLHGMGDSGVFYTPEFVNELAQALAKSGTALLAFNNRGAHNRKKLKVIDDALPEEDRVYPGGTHYELIADCVKDIDGATVYLKERRFTTLYLVGHSTGANKICAYQVRTKSNPFSKYVLSGPGDDSGLFFNELGENKFKLALDYAKDAIKTGRALKIMPKYTGMYPFSAQAAIDIIDPNGDHNTFPYFEATTKRLGHKPLFAEYSRIDIPLLAIMGEFDEYAYTAGNSQQVLDLLKRHTNKSIGKNSAFELVAGADHSFRGFEPEFAHQVSSWLANEV